MSSRPKNLSSKSKLSQTAPTKSPASTSSTGGVPTFAVPASKLRPSTSADTGPQPLLSIGGSDGHAKTAPGMNGSAHSLSAKSGPGASPASCTTTTGLRFGSFASVVPPRTQSAPPTLPEQMNLPEARAPVSQSSLREQISEPPKPAHVEPAYSAGASTFEDPVFPRQEHFKQQRPAQHQAAPQGNEYNDTTNGYRPRYGGQAFLPQYQGGSRPHNPYYEGRGHGYPPQYIMDSNAAYYGAPMPPRPYLSQPLPPFYQPTSTPSGDIPSIAPRVFTKVVIKNPETGEEVKLAPIVPKLSQPVKTESAEPSVATTVKITRPEDGKEILLSEQMIKLSIDEVREERSSPMTPPSSSPVPEGAVVGEQGTFETKESPLTGDVEKLGPADETLAIGELGDLSDEEFYQNTETESQDEDELSESETVSDARDYDGKIHAGQKTFYPPTVIGYEAPQAGDIWRYSFAFLLQFKSICIKPPSELKLDIPMEQKKAIEHSHQGGRQGRQSGGTRRGGRNAPAPYTGPPIKLRKSENAWADARNKTTSEEHTVVSAVKGIMNKMTEETFDSLSDKIMALGIMSESVLHLVIDLLFDKSVEEPIFAPMYARLCLKIVTKEIETLKTAAQSLPEDAEKPKLTSRFRHLLIQKCQIEYEKKQSWSKDRLARLAKQAEAKDAPESPSTGADADAGGTASKPAVQSGELTEEDYRLIKLKRRVLGNMGFIGELFKVSLISANIMHQVIGELLSNIENPEEEEIESLCRLLCTVGHRLDIPQAASHWEKYVELLTILSTHPKLTPRVRFRVLDTLEFRQNGSKLVKKPSAAQVQRRPDRQSISQHRQSSQNEAARQSDDSRWSQSSRASESIRIIKIRDSQEARPSQIPSQTSTRPVSAVSGSSTHSNRFGALEDDRKSKLAGEPSARPLQADSSRASEESLDRAGKTTAIAVERAIFQDSEKAPPATTATEKKPKRSPEEILGRIPGLVTEYVQFENPEELLGAFQDLPENDMGLVRIFEKAFTSKRDQACTAASILPILYSNGVTSGDFVRAFTIALAEIDELAIDMPIIHELAGVLLAYSIDIGAVSLGFVMNAVLAEVARRDSAIVARTIASTLTTLAKVKNEQSAFKAISQLSKDAAAPMTNAESIGRTFEIFQRADALKYWPALETKLFEQRLDMATTTGSFFDKARPIAMEFASSKNDEEIIKVLATRSFASMYSKDWRKDLEAVYLPQLLTLISVFDIGDSACLQILNVLTSHYQSTEAEFFDRAFRGLYDCGIIPSLVYFAWKEDTSIDKRAALFKVARWLERLEAERPQSASPAPSEDQEAIEE